MSDDVPDRGAPGGNNNTVSHGLHQKRNYVRKNIAEPEQKMLVDISRDPLDRLPEDEHIGARDGY